MQARMHPIDYELIEFLTLDTGGAAAAAVPANEYCGRKKKKSLSSVLCNGIAQPEEK